MTENEAIKCLEKQIEIQPCMNVISAFEIAIQALEEIQQYRAIGTVEEIQAFEVKKKMIEKSNFCSEQYRADTDTAYQCGYNKAIDEFVSTLVPRLTDAIYQKDVESMINLINGVAEELKVGGIDE